MSLKLTLLGVILVAALPQSYQQQRLSYHGGQRPFQVNPHSGRPVQSFPQQGFPQTGFPQTGFHQTGFPQTGFPVGGAPGGFGQVGGYRPGQVGSIGQTGLVGNTQTSPQQQYNCAATASQGQYGIDSTCEKWCKAPQQYWGGSYICCDDRPAVCPPIRVTCPRFGGVGPVCCFVDSQCQIPTDKCCFDKCLGHKVCKSAYKQGF
uniref:Glycine-rich cell wall structural protein 1-like n=1 Tax=Hirondellea gigas TaxID=1518452 RepID=A0A6A7FP29_9CRUS